METDGKGNRKIEPGLLAIDSIVNIAIDSQVAYLHKRMKKAEEGN